MPLLSDQTIARLNAIPILDVVRHFAHIVDWDGRGHIPCPLHRENTPSFHIRLEQNDFHCFGCGKGGGPIQFIMHILGQDWGRAARTLAAWANVPIDGEEDRDPQQNGERQRCIGAMQIAHDLMVGALRGVSFDSQDQDLLEAKRYCIARFGDPADPSSPAHSHRLGSPSTEFGKELLSRVSEDTALELGLLRRSKRGDLYCPFRGRLVFPIQTPGGVVVGFAGRRTREGEDVVKSPKYINSPESPIFSKRQHFYGFPSAVVGVKDKGFLFLVEGYADALRLHSLGYPNTIATMGTALSKEQIAVIKGLTNRVTLIPDTDSAGMEAGLHHAKALSQVGVQVQIILLPQGSDGAKNDADSYFKTPEDVERARCDYMRPFLVWRVELALQRSAGGQDQTLLLAELRSVAEDLLGMEAAEREMLLPLLHRTYGGENLWNSLLNPVPSSDGGLIKPSAAEWEPMRRYGIANSEGRHALIFKTRDGELEAVSNFTVEPLYFIEPEQWSISAAGRRIIRIRNERGETRVVELPGNGTALRSSADARAFFSRLGNYSFFGPSGAMSALVRMVNDLCRPTREVDCLGWNPGIDGWVWADGIYSQGELIPFDSCGVALVNGKQYYLPIANQWDHGGADPHQQSSRFRARVGSMRPVDYFVLFQRVYGDNGRIALLYLIASLMRDVIFDTTKMFPILNAFGPPMTGKSQLGRSMMALCTDMPLPMNLPNSTMVSLTSALQTYRNGLVCLDEYSNDVRDDKQEFLKSIYDGGGRSKSVLVPGTDQRVTSTSRVLSGVYLSGQQVPENDVALFTRVIMLNFDNTRFDIHARARLTELQAAEREGLAQVVHSVLDQRGLIEQMFPEVLRTQCGFIEAELANRSVRADSRTVGIWGILLAVHTILNEPLGLGIDQDSIRAQVLDSMAAQCRTQHYLGDVQQFWEVFSALVMRGDLEVGYDYLVEPYHKSSAFPISSNGYEPMEDEPIIIINTPSVLNSYLHSAREYGIRTLSRNTMLLYLRKWSGFVGDGVRRKFKGREKPSTVTVRSESFRFGVKSLTVRGMAFSLSMAGLDWRIEDTQGWDGETPLDQDQVQQLLGNLPF